MRVIFTFSILLFFTLASYAQIDLSRGLVAALLFNGDAKDVSGNNHDGQLMNGVSLTLDRFGNPSQAFLFDGEDDYIRVPDDGAFSTPKFSLAIWFQTFSDNLQNLVAKRDYQTLAGSGRAQYQFFINYPPFPGIGSNIVGNNSTCTAVTGSSYLSTNNQVCTNKWHFAVVTFDGANHRIYIDGELKKEAPTEFNGMLVCNSELRFGNWFEADLIPFKGKMDDIRWYNRALNQDEILALYGNFPTSPTACTNVVNAGFTTPDTVCVNQPVDITNTSIGASSFYWNFCVANSSTTPEGTNLGNFGFSTPVFTDYAKDGDNYYAFVTNNFPGKLVRLDFGNSLLNTPSIHDFGNLNGVIPDFCEGVQVVKNEGKWYAIIVGGQPDGRVIKIEFGTSLSNNSPNTTNWGNIGALHYPHDLYVFEDDGRWYGLTINSQTNSITRFSFTNSFNNTPTGVNLGNIGSLNYPTGIYAIEKDGNWYAFVSNEGGDRGDLPTASLTRLDFGNSLLNIPTGVNLGNPGNKLVSARDLTIYQSCNEIFGFIVNYSSANDIVRLNFNNSLTSVPTAVSLGNIGDLSFPHCISKLFRVENDLYGFVVNVTNNTITRLKFSGCNGASIPSSTAQNPDPVTYNKPGVYNINLITDDGLPTQSSFCRQVVVIEPPKVEARNDTTICPGASVQLTAKGEGVIRIRWSPSKGLSDSATANPIATPDATAAYVVTVTNAGGCEAKDTVIVTVRTPQECRLVLPSFTTPDTVCVNTPVKITNTSSGASSYYWNFCVADLNAPPSGQNLGNVDNNLSQPVFMDYVFYNNRYYGFLINHYPGALIRLDFGNSLLNTPTSTNLGNFGGIIPPGYGAEGIQVVSAEGKWYVIVVGGYEPSGSTPRILKIDFGSNITNPTPTATDWGNIGDMSQPIDLHVFKEGGNWYGFTVNGENNTITRFNFTNSFDNTPTAVNVGNIGNLTYPTGIYAINDNNFWRVFIVNAGSPTNNVASSLTRLDFGTSLLNTPTAVNLGNPGDLLKLPRDLTIMKQCGQIIGFVVNDEGSELIKMDFHNSLATNPEATSLGNVGDANFPHSISKLFRVQDDVYGFVTNVKNNTITRLKFSGCTNANLPSSTAQNPPPVVYNAPGVYNINLTVDDGQPTQGAYCKQVVVLANVHTPLQQRVICSGDSVLLTSSNTTGNQWSTGSTNISIYAKTAGPYWVQSINASGCVNIDSFNVSVKSLPIVDLGSDTSLCEKENIVLNAGNNGATYLWQNGQTTQTIVASQAGLYSVLVTKDGCSNKASIEVTTLSLPVVHISGSNTICKDGKTALEASGGVLYFWTPSTGLSSSSGANTIASPTSTTQYEVLVTGQNGCKAKDSITITVTPKPVFTAGASKAVLCKGDTATLTATGGDVYSWSPVFSLSSPNSSTTLAYPTVTTQYKVVIEENRCQLKDSLFVRLSVATKPNVVTSKSNDINCFIGEATLHTGGGSQYLWTPATGLSDPSSSNPVVRINTTTTYHLFVTTTDGCLVEDSITVYVLQGGDGSGFPVPNAFTPNGDGKNDCFGVKSWGDVSDFSLNIYNRWGERLFYADNPTQCWDGIYKGQRQPDDVYVYWIRAKTRCGNIFRKGSFALIR